MGLIKKDGYVIKGVELKPAYAKIIWLEATTSPNQDDKISVSFGISTERKNLDEGKVLSAINYTCSCDRSKDELFKQAYEAAKQDIFEGWEDDIIESENESEDSDNIEE